MTDKQIEICDKILRLLIDNNGQLYQDNLISELNKIGYESTEIGTLVNILIKDHNILDYDRIQIGDYNVIRLILKDKGFDVFKIGIKVFLNKKKRNDFINGFYFKLLIFIIPTIIACVSIWINYSNNKGKNSLKGLYYDKSQIDSMVKVINKNFSNNRNTQDSILRIVNHRNKDKK
jgi:hypothetical protein